MDASEKLAKSFLEGSGFEDIRFEPDGNVTPDFLVNGRIAVEVRRLNQNHDDGSGKGPRGLESMAIPLWKNVETYLTALGPPPASGQSWYVYYRFSRPVPLWKDLKRELDQALLPFMADPNPQPFERKMLGDFEIKVFRAPLPKPTFFRPAGNSDRQSGGLLIELIAANLSLCISEKSAKIASRKGKYPEWWLVLPDHIGFSLDEFERDLFREQVTVSNGVFDRIILVDPRDTRRSFTVYP